MELYVASSYNETMSGGETLSSISEKSCISGVNNRHEDFPPQAYLVILLSSCTIKQKNNKHSQALGGSPGLVVKGGGLLANFTQ